ncbi:MAG: ParB/RepB/Spo0J family partition protein [Phycisphaerales bacterium]|nr:ParB/RepB/Spo0J family partition protein [Phycisphaerales bacterium]
MTEKRKESADNLTSSNTSPTTVHKPTMGSRLGRGLGSLIPASPKQPLAPAPPTPRTDASVVGVDSIKVASTQSSSTAQASAPSNTQAIPMTFSGHGSANSSTGNTSQITPAANGSSSELSISFIARNARQPRERFDERAIRSLAESVRQHGLLQPVVVRKLQIPAGGKTHELIAGERRLRAFELLGRSSIPVITRDADEAQSAVLALIENVQREDLNPLERARALQRLISDFSWTQQQAAERVGLDRASVANLLRLNDLDPFTAGCVREGRLTQGHAKALLAIESVGARRAIAEKSLHDEWSVRQLEREVQRVKSASGLTTPSPTHLPRRASAQVGDLERRLGLHLGTKVHIKRGRKPGSGTLAIQFFSLDQFDGILSKLKFDPNSLID